MNAEIYLKGRVFVDCLRACCEAPLKRFIMMRQSSSRNQRYKGVFRLRHFLQICLLLAICIWLVYQVKRSHEKKKAFEERKEVEEQSFSFGFGRKDLPSVKDDELMREIRKIDEDEVEDREDEVQEQEMKKEDAPDEEGKGDVDDWIDEQEEEFKNLEENESLVEKADSVSLEHEDGVLDARKENNERDDVSRSVTHETHMTEAEADAGLKGDSSIVAVAVSNRIYNSSNNGDFHGFMSNLSSVAMGENTTLSEAANLSMNGTSSEKNDAVSNRIYNSSNNVDFNGFMSNLSSVAMGENITLSEAAYLSMNGTSSEKNGSVFGFFKQENGSILSPIPAEENNSKELQANSTTLTLPVVTAIPTANETESVVSDSLTYREILGNETASLILVDQKHTIQNATHGETHSKLVDLEVEFEHNSMSKTSEEQESEDQFATTSFSKNEVNLSHNAVTEEEREARTDLSTLPEIQNDLRHHYDETEE